MGVTNQRLASSRRSAQHETRFSWVLSGQRRGPDPLFDQDFCASPYAAVTPSKGAIVPEWLLVVPRAPCFAIAKLQPDHRSEVWRVAELAAEAIRKTTDKSIVIFEHGAASWGGLHGCGVDQGHLHVVALGKDFVSRVVEGSPSLAWACFASLDDAWACAEHLSDYLLMVSGVGAWLAEVKSPVSQFFRRHVAAHVRNDAEWDYKTFPHRENGNMTSRLFAQSFE